MDSLYKVEDWKALTTTGRNLFNHNYRIHADDIPGFKLVNVYVMHNEPEVHETAYLFEKEGSGGRIMVRVDVTEAVSMHHALETLKRQLYHTMKKAEVKTLKLGDIHNAENFPGTTKNASFTFVRGNVKIVVTSVGQEEYAIFQHAEYIDKELLYGHKGTETPSTDKIAVKRGEPHPLVKDLPHHSPDSDWIHAFVPDGELYREKNLLHYKPDSTGSKSVTVNRVRK